ncbi:unnamed protein product [Didymodactylos carnosus]|uniref:Prolyl-tRNA synthetase n=1 Tax=Didymodactylos carnosus TaxID=1234261 RepID=A0A813RTE5_9BILA|nr:unnamed protein product [Didymodactylos carnosus]CAF0817096.1 unnamed protein product [Didymodactylos carnosus]CAF3569044.1 unnamed protein product [Didymodactylos carnosus]CAF3601189.1 unnamed protein product [Didymodactylos carnosus]
MTQSELTLSTSDIAVVLTLRALGNDLPLQVRNGDETRLQLDSVSLTSRSAICRYLARKFNQLYGTTILQQSEIDHWIDFSDERLSCDCNKTFQTAIDYLNSILSSVTYLVGYNITLADIFVWCALYTNPLYQKQSNIPANVQRYYDTLRRQIPFSSLLDKEGRQDKTVPYKMKEEGKFVDLPDAKMGEVVVRFPPEASGYLHIGHAKAALLNQYYQQLFQGVLIMRFDDTNPAKENAEFEKVILEDLEMLGVKYDRFSHTSDHFDALMDYCKQLINKGLAYCDDTDAEEMKKQREQRQNSVNRNNSVETNLKHWDEMIKGTEYGQKFCVRLKIDMDLNNGCMRDPTIYRCKPEEHVRTGNKYKVYPTYDFACPIVDCLEGVTHALRTTEYHDRDEQYYWILDALGLRKPHIYEYSRLNMQHTVLSKRKLTWFVNNGLVTGWDDPRFPTVRGILRHGMTVDGLKQFIITQGSSRSVVLMDWDKIWAINKKFIDPVAPRYTALIKKDVIDVKVTNIKDEECQQYPKHPKVTFCHIVKANKNYNFKFCRNKTGALESIEAETQLENKDYKKTTKLTWLAKTSQASFTPTICVHFDNIMTKPSLEKDDKVEDFVNHSSQSEYEMIGDHDLANLKKGEYIQILRKGYYICDQPYESQQKPCILYNIPDGAKDKPTSLKCAATSETSTNSTANASSAKTSGEDSSKTTNSKTKKTTTTTNSEKQQQAQNQDTNKSVEQKSLTTTTVANDNVEKLTEQITTQGNKVRDLKTSKAAKMSLLLRFIIIRRCEDKKMASAGNNSEADTLKTRIDEQGDSVRKLKSDKASKFSIVLELIFLLKDDIDQAVKVLLDLKAQYKTLTGTDLAPAPAAKKEKEKKPAQQNAKQGVSEKAGGDQPKTNKQTEEKASKSSDEKSSKKETSNTNVQQQQSTAQSETKKQTKLGIEIKKEEDISGWYGQVVRKGELIENYDVSGCYILRPWAYFIWEQIKEYVDHEINEIGVQNCYFPLFVSHAALHQEKTHIADFAPEVAWVTKSGDSELAQPIAIRPTSETIMYPSYAKWIQSHRDLPLRLNQWNNVVRWEFKHPQPFLRTREFLWQEGHTAFATEAEAAAEVYQILDLYERVYTDLLAIPVVRGRKTEKEKFAGADWTTTVEAYISASGRGIQGATSHHLGQNFSKMFNITFDDPNTKAKSYVYQNSWGLTTRTIGVMTMIHGDNKGLVLPPRVARYQMVIVPCGIVAAMTKDEEDSLINQCKQLETKLKKAGFRVHLDYRDNYAPGWKFNHWELKGVPIRVELGPNDVSKSQLMAVLRHTGEKLAVPLNDCEQILKKLLDQIHNDLFKKAKSDLDSHTIVADNWTDFLKGLDNQCIVLAPFCGEPDCEDKIKKDSARDAVVEEGAPAMGAKGLCIPFKPPKELSKDQHCVHPDCSNKPKYYTLFGRSY